MNILSCIYFFAGHPVYILSLFSFLFLYLFFVDYLMTVDVIILASTYIYLILGLVHMYESYQKFGNVLMRLFITGVNVLVLMYNFLHF